jgi:hypothetical protein
MTLTYLLQVPDYNSSEQSCSLAEDHNLVTAETANFMNRAPVDTHTQLSERPSVGKSEGRRETQDTRPGTASPAEHQGTGTAFYAAVK